MTKAHLVNKLIEALEGLLECSELNMDDMENNTLDAIQFAKEVLRDIKTE